MTNLLSKYTILYGKVMTLVVTIQSVARRWTTKVPKFAVLYYALVGILTNWETFMLFMSP